MFLERVDRADVEFTNGDVPGVPENDGGLALLTSRLRLAALMMVMVVPLWAKAAGQGLDPQPRRYVIYNTGIVCRAAPCFSYCARDLDTNEARRFSQFSLFSLSAGESETLRTMEPVIVEGGLQSVGGHIPPAVEMTVFHVVRRAPELASRPERCG